MKTDTHWQEEYEVRWKQWRDDILANTPQRKQESLIGGFIATFLLCSGIWTLVIWAIVRHWKP